MGQAACAMVSDSAGKPSTLSNARSAHWPTAGATSTQAAEETNVSLLPEERASPGLGRSNRAGGYGAKCHPASASTGSSQHPGSFMAQCRGDLWLRVGTKHQLAHSFTRANSSLQAAFWNKYKSAQLVSAWYLFRGLCQAAAAFITCCSRSSFTRPQKL